MTEVSLGYLGNIRVRSDLSKNQGGILETIGLLYTTLPSQEASEQLAKQCLEQKLAACVNIFQQGTSLYFWEGKLEESKECYLMFKTTPTLLAQLKACILKHHPYENPAILTWEAASTTNFTDYLLKAVHQNR
jgi:periplasmic divalent cation tolerance protein